MHVKYLKKVSIDFFLVQKVNIDYSSLLYFFGSDSSLL